MPPQAALAKRLEINEAVNATEKNCLDDVTANDYRMRYREIMQMGENDIRMTKVQQKISGCFKSLDGAKIFCRVRSYLLTAQKHDISPTEALKTLFAGKLPEVFFTE